MELNKPLSRSLVIVLASLALVFLVCWIIDPGKAVLPTAFCAAMFFGALMLQPNKDFGTAVRLLFSAYRLVPFAFVVGVMLAIGKGTPLNKLISSIMLFALFLFGSELTEAAQRRIVKERER